MTSRVFGVLLTLLGFALARAEEGRELQVPLNAEGSLEIIDRRLEQDLHLFSGYSGFREARLFQVADTLYALEIYCRPTGRLFKYRRLLSAGQVETLRQEVTALLSLRPSALQDQSGRTRFLIQTFLFSYGFYSWAIPVALDLEGRSAQITGLLVGSAGFFTPFAITSRTPVSEASASLSGLGGLTGMAQGIALSELLLGKESSPRTRLGLATAGSLADLASGFGLAWRWRLDAGTAEVIGWGGIYGLLMGVGATHVAFGVEDEHQRLAAAAALAGSGLGCGAGYALARQDAYTRGDADLLVLSGILGAHTGLALARFSDSENSRLYTGALMAGSILGLGVGQGLLRERDFSLNQSRIVLLSTVGGYLLGGATSLILEADSDQARLSLTLLGGLGGSWLTYRTFAGEAREEAVTARWDIRLHPEALALWAKGPISPSALPFLSCTLAF